MAYTTPSTWADGAVVSAADLNAQIKNNVRYLKGTDGVIYLENAIEQAERTVPTTPAAGYGRIYIGSAGDNNGIASCVDDGGLIYQMVKYATGTWTPTYLGLSTAGTTTYTTQQGNYVQIGRMVVASFELTWTNATGTGSAAIYLPSTAASTMEFPMPIYTTNVTFSAGTPYGFVNTGTNYLILGTPTTNAATATLAIETAGTIYGTAIYFV